MGFPAAGDEIYRNEAGEPTGWGKPDEGPPYCDVHGFSHAATCDEVDDYNDKKEEEEDDCIHPGIECELNTGIDACPCICENCKNPEVEELDPDLEHPHGIENEEPEDRYVPRKRDQR